MNRDHAPDGGGVENHAAFMGKKPPYHDGTTRALAEDTGWSKHTVITMLKRMAVKGDRAHLRGWPGETCFSGCRQGPCGARADADAAQAAVFRGAPRCW